MTRKRFTKLMMSMGYTRNEANEKAAKLRDQNIPYRCAWYGKPLEAKLKMGVDLSSSCDMTRLVDTMTGTAYAFANVASTMRAMDAALACWIIRALDTAQACCILGVEPLQKEEGET